MGKFGVVARVNQGDRVIASALVMAQLPVLPDDYHWELDRFMFNTIEVVTNEQRIGPGFSIRSMAEGHGTFVFTPIVVHNKTGEAMPYSAALGLIVVDEAKKNEPLLRALATDTPPGEPDPSCKLCDGTGMIPAGRHWPDGIAYNVSTPCPCKLRGGIPQ